MGARLLVLLEKLMMDMEEQEAAFERELHALCTRFFDEWDITPESMLEMLESEKIFVLSILDGNSEADDDEEYA